MTFDQPPEPLTRAQRNTVIGISVFVGLTRLLALSRTPWDWDEALFCMGVRSYDVPSHHPHPPGYPLFVLAGKIVRLIIHNDFRALQAVVLIAALALFPALFALARELRFPFAVAAGGAALYAFFPAVWYYGGTALSDIPSIVLVFISATLLLRGCRERRAYLLGALVLGISAGVRPQNLLIGCAPALIATWCAVRRRAWREIAAAIGIGASVVLASYAGAALASSSWHGYLAICAAQSRYVRQVDSFLNPGRPPLVALLRNYFVDPIRAGVRLDAALAAMTALGLLAAFRRASYLVIPAMFLPFQLFAWLMLDMENTSRYAIAYLPMYALFIALALLFPRPATHDPRPLLIAGLIVYLMIWMRPSLGEVRQTESPAAAAMRALLRFPPSQTIYAHGGMGPFVSLYLAGRPVVYIEKESDLPSDPAVARAPYVREGLTLSHDAQVFTRGRNSHLATFARKRYFEVSIVRVGDARVFQDGWYSEEGDGTHAWRWMSSRAVMLLPPAGPRARLTLRFAIPSEAVPAAPVVTLQLNGRVVVRTRIGEEQNEKSWDVDARGDTSNELVVTINRVVNPKREHLGDDARDLGLQLQMYGWETR